VEKLTDFAPDEPAAIMRAAVAVEALENAEDVRAARAALAEPDPGIPLEDVLAKYADDLAAYPDGR
jgi:hypothetical protein